MQHHSGDAKPLKGIFIGNTSFLSAAPFRRRLGFGDVMPKLGSGLARRAVACQLPAQDTLVACLRDERFPQHIAPST